MSLCRPWWLCKTGSRPLGPPCSREAVVPAKKYATLAAVAFVMFYLVSRPDEAAQTVNTAAAGFASAAGSLARFVNELA